MAPLGHELMVSAWPEPASAMAAGSIAGVRDGVEVFVLGIIDTPPERGRSQLDRPTVIP